MATISFGLINTLLDLAKVKTGRMELLTESFASTTLSIWPPPTVEPLLEDGRVRLVQDITPRLPPLKTDRDKLEQVLLDLLSDAAKFTERR